MAVAAPVAKPAPAAPGEELLSLANQEQTATTEYEARRAPLQQEFEQKVGAAQKEAIGAADSLSAAAKNAQGQRDAIPPLPKNMAQHIDPKEMNQTAQAFMTLGALFGLASRQPLTAALGNMTAAMKGVQEGDAAQYDKAMQEYKVNVEHAEKQAKATMKKIDDALNDKNLDLTAKLQRVKLIEAEAGGPLRGLDQSFKTTMEMYKSKRQALKDFEEVKGKAEDRAMRFQEHRDRMAQLGESRAAREANTIEGKLGQFEHMLKTGKITQEQYDRSVEHLTGAPTNKGSAVMRGQAMRVQMAANQLRASLQSIAGLPIEASTGLFGTRDTHGGGLMASAKESLTNKATTQEVQSYRVMAQGIQRSLATLEAGGVATGLVGLTKQMDGVILQEGDTNATKLNKLAEIRQIAEHAIEVLLSEPAIPPEQKAQMSLALNDIRKVVPFTQQDLNALANSKSGAVTLADVVSDTATEAGVKPKPAASGWTPEKEKRLQELRAKHGAQ